MATTRYQNMDNIENNKTFRDMYKWMRERRHKVKDLSVAIPHHPDKQVSRIRQNREAVSYTWIGHSTFFIQMNGLNIITDPVWAKRMGLQKRLTAPGLEVEELPEIDIVVISHGHYDHLDFGSIKRLRGNPTYYVPVGLKPLFLRKGYQKVIEANWWDTFLHEGGESQLTLHFVPAQHWTRRTMFDTNTSHWGGWVFQSAEQTLYFVGDTGYFRGFKEIGERFEIDTVFMPIGAYEPEWFMRVSHINPEDAVRAFLELRAKTFVPMHYGAYRLADDTGPEALERLYAEWNRLRLPEEQLTVMKMGESVFKE